MRFEFKPSFDRSVKNLDTQECGEIKNVTIKLIEILCQNTHLCKGIGLKRLRGNYWEIRSGLETRVLFRWDKDVVEFVLAGDHEQIKRFLRKT